MSIMERPNPLVTVFAILNAAVLITAAYAMMNPYDANLPSTQCGYQPSARWATVAARFAFAVAAIGIGNVVTSWKHPALRKLYLWMVVTLGITTAVLMGMGINITTTTPLAEGHTFSIVERQWTDPARWGGIQECFVKEDICKGLTPTSQTKVLPVIEHFKHPIQFHCCQPPNHCSFVRINGTYWQTPVNDQDCIRWMENDGAPTFDSDFCKLGYMHTVFDYWLQAVVFKCFLWTMCFIVSVFLEDDHIQMMKRIPN